MINLKFLKIAKYIIIPVVLILLFEWVNVESYYEDQSFVETSIHIDETLTAKQKADNLKEIYKSEKEMEVALIIIKILLAFSTIALVTNIYYTVKLNNKEDEKTL
jgi:hypothetical protein